MKILVGLLLISTLSFSQDNPPDTAKVSADSVFIRKGKIISIETYSKRFNPRKALLYSAILPGLGQVYNKKYWKVPLVYGGLIGLISVVDFYNKAGIKYRNDLFDLLNNGGTVSPALGLSEAQLRTIIDSARRQRDYFLIIAGFFYVLQLIDAHVDAHLKEFDLNPKLKVKIEPMMDSNYYTGTSTGIAIKLRF